MEDWTLVSEASWASAPSLVVEIQEALVIISSSSELAVSTSSSFLFLLTLYLFIYFGGRGAGFLLLVDSLRG